ncbi:MAG: hypothetical protein Q9212_006350 [Teloschistes hypoglaucus]
MAPITLLTLPAEIRNQIYRELLVYDTIEIYYPWDKPSHLWIEVTLPKKDAFRDGGFFRDFLALLLVNRQMYNEALPIFLGENKFHADFNAFYRYFVNGTGARRMALLSDVTLSIEFDHDDFYDDGEHCIGLFLNPERVCKDWPSLNVFLGHKLKLRLAYKYGLKEDVQDFWGVLVRMDILDLEGQLDCLAIHIDWYQGEIHASIWKCEKGSKFQVVARDQIIGRRRFESYFLRYL